MSNTANTTAIGAFVLGAVAIAASALVFFGDGLFFKNNQNFVMYFDRSIQGLELGAPLKLRGVKIGEVTRIESHVNQQALSIVNAVYVRVTRDELHYEDEEDPKEFLDTLVTERGMRAQLRIQSLLTGLLYIEVDFMGADSEMKLWGLDPDTPELPTARTEIEELSQLANRFDFDALSKNFRNIAENLDRFITNPETQALSANINNSLRSFTKLADDMDRVLLQEVVAAVDQFDALAAGINQDYPEVAADLRQSMVSMQAAFSGLEHTITNANHLLSDDSPLIYAATRTLNEINKAASKISALADTLERQPEALIKGKSDR